MFNSYVRLILVLVEFRCEHGLGLGFSVNLYLQIGPGSYAETQIFIITKRNASHSI